MSKMTEIEGQLQVRGARFALLVARFNSFVVESLVAGAVDCLKRHGADEKDLHIVRVPGAFEMPLVAKRLAASKKYDAIIALGAVIRTIVADVFDEAEVAVDDRGGLLDVHGGVDVGLLVHRLGPDTPPPVLQDDVAHDIAKLAGPIVPPVAERGRQLQSRAVEALPGTQQGDQFTYQSLPAFDLLGRAIQRQLIPT